ncbi:M23 family metallopeptidase [Parvularcula dongshanensis]|uniref:Murein DD-endopeptidase MepM/ murein hydrolase activator NlpD n=1 Tax=Parvularcula dongshanensis TaxID=1173995 RepID=A0A840I4Y6_9PROT|nr:M23 family metallopeptidase [Parvularcula dongshanensis]MBB4659238.1 murein DD-endopeptidase MepM/ murein hydrolase activator NlpD [Parvularcula dongshanensis]
MRTSLRLLASTLAILAATPALAQDHAASAPVRFGTDPGAAHPQFATPVAYAVSAPAALEYEAPSSKDAIRAVASAERQVTVAAGDTVYGIARRYGLKPADIIEQNGLAAPYTLSLGQTLRLPVEAEPQGSSVEVEVTPVSATPTPPRRSDNLVTSRIEPTHERERLDALYAVRPGDTLFGVARKFGFSVQELAAVNHMDAPYTLSLGQRLIIPGAVPAEPAAAAPAETQPATPADPISDAVLVSKTPDARFAWPLKGAVVEGYGMSPEGARNDGINIAAPLGAPIRAAADGEVVYKGAELEGYGNLLLIKHEDGWVSAYAHTDTILVKRGDRVRQGQVVAKVGQSGSVSAPQLHFELRHDLKPQDPLAALNGTLRTASTQVSY